MFSLLNRLSIRNRIWGIVLIFIGSIVLTSAIDIGTLRETLQQEKEATIRQVVEGGYSVLTHYADLERNGSLSHQETFAHQVAHGEVANEDTFFSHRLAACLG